MIGVDVSTFVGLARVEGPEIMGKIINFPKHSRWNRVQLIADEVKRVFSVWQPQSGEIIFESYAYGNHNSLVTLVEIGTVLRYSLFQQRVNWWEVNPLTVKKWLTGSGKAKKVDMAKAVKVRWKYSSPSDDVTDAVALSQYGVWLHQQDMGVQITGVRKGF